MNSFRYAGTIAHAIVGQPLINMARKRSAVNSRTFNMTSLFIHLFHQANYSFSNANIDELIAWRVSKGLSRFSMQWPVILEVGISAAMNKHITTSKCFNFDIETIKPALRKVTYFVPICRKTADQYRG